MSRASVRTILPLDTFAKILGIHPLHWNQVVYPLETDDRGLTCDEPMIQYAWMRGGRAGREDVAETIALAEQKISSELGFLPGVAWIAGEELSFPRPANPTLFNSSGLDVRGFNQTFQTKNGYVISGGVEAKSVILADAVVVYSDLDGDLYFETATVTAPTTVTDIDEIALFFPGENGDNAWEIRPLRSVSIAAGVVTIVCNREQLVIRTLQEGYGEAASRAVDSQTAANFLTVLDIYRRYNDGGTQAQFVWAPSPSLCDCVSAGNCASCTFGLQNGCLFTRDARLGVVSAQPADWDAATQSFSASVYQVMRAPDKVRAYYRSGYRDLGLVRPLHNMSADMARTIAYYAASLLDRPLCGCKPLEAQIMYWRQDLTASITTQAGTTSFRVNRRVLDNPLGTTRGAINAWRVITRMKLGEGVDNA